MSVTEGTATPANVGGGNQSDTEKEKPRQITLLSDGTGNSAAAVWRTNVWRVFESLDLSEPSRVAIYDESNDEVVWAISGNGTNGTIDDNIAKQIPSRFRGEVVWLRHTGKILSMKDNHAFMRSRRTTRTPERQSSLISKR